MERRSDEFLGQSPFGVSLVLSDFLCRLCGGRVLTIGPLQVDYMEGEVASICMGLCCD